MSSTQSPVRAVADGDGAREDQEKDAQQLQLSAGETTQTSPTTGTTTAGHPPSPETAYPRFFLSVVLNTSLLLSMFLVALDMARIDEAPMLRSHTII